MYLNFSQTFSINLNMQDVIYVKDENKHTHTECTSVALFEIQGDKI